MVMNPKRGKTQRRDTRKGAKSKKLSRKKILFVITAILVIVASGVFIVDRYVMPLPADFDNPPQFCTSDFTELWKIQEISKFRSFAGHDYSDSFEHDRSMKHYYAPKEEFGNSNDNVSIFSPVNGTIDYIRDESHKLSNGEIRGKQIGIRVKNYPDFVVIIFHVNVFSNISVGDEVNSGQQLGFADIREAHDFDIAISRKIGLTRERLYSYFQVMTDEVFAEYQKYGISSRSEMIKPKEEVDSLTPNWGERNEDDWVTLTTPSSTVLNSYKYLLAKITQKHIS